MSTSSTALSGKRVGSAVHYITQKASDLSKPRYGTVFKDWLYKLKRGDKLPRGKWFKCKKAGKPYLVMDEAHQLRS
jgi:hypothetical protein